MLHKNLQNTEKQIEDKKQEELKRLDQRWERLIGVTKTHFQLIMDAQLEAFKKAFKKKFPDLTNSSWVSKKKRSRRALRSRSVGKKTSKVRKKKARRHVKHKKQK